MHDDQKTLRLACLLVAAGLAACDDGGSGAADAAPDAAPLTFDAAPPGDSGAPPPRDIDCAALAATYGTRCPEHLGISDDTTACAAIRDGQAAGSPRAPIARAAAVCAQAGESCDRIFVCVADEHGLSALTTTAHVTGGAVVEGDAFIFDARDAWAWLATKGGGDPGDLEVLFTHEGEPWYFKLEDFAERAFDLPYRVDLDHPVKLENGEDNVEITVGTVEIDAFSLPGAFELSARAMDEATGEEIDLRVRGTFE